MKQIILPFMLVSFFLSRSAYSASIELGLLYPVSYSQVSDGSDKMSVVGLAAIGAAVRTWISQHTGFRMDLDLEFGAGGITKRRIDALGEYVLWGVRDGDTKTSLVTSSRDSFLQWTLLGGLSFQNKNLEAVLKGKQGSILEKSPWPLKGDTFGITLGTGLYYSFNPLLQLQTSVSYTQSSYISNPSSRVTDLGLKLGLMREL